MRDMLATVEKTALMLPWLDRVDRVSEWVRNNPDIFEDRLYGFDDLVSIVNDISSGSSLLDCLPKIQKIKLVLGDTPMPLVDQMVEGNYAFGLREAKHPMYFGKLIKSNLIDSPTPADMKHQIGTPSMDTSDEALAIGTAGHILERTFYQWARKKGLQPQDGWRKDDWLQALDEGLFLLMYEGKQPILKDLFMTPNSKGGLGWLDEDKYDAFVVKMSKHNK